MTTIDASGPVLYCYDGSDGARAALRQGAQLLSGRDAAVLTVCREIWDSVVGPPLAGLPPNVTEDYDRVVRRQAQDVAAEGAELVGASTVRVERSHGSTWRTILDAADAIDACAIVVGSRGLGAVKGPLLGSVSHAVVSRTHRPVLVLPAPDGD